MNKCVIIRLPRSEIVADSSAKGNNLEDGTKSEDASLAPSSAIPQEETSEVNDSFEIIPELNNAEEHNSTDGTALSEDVSVSQDTSHSQEVEEEEASFDSSDFNVNFEYLNFEGSENFPMSYEPEYVDLISSCESVTEMNDDSELSASLDVESLGGESSVLGPRAKKTFSREKRKSRTKDLPNVFADYGKDTAEAEQFFSGNQIFLCATCGCSFVNVEKLLQHMAFHESPKTIRGRFLRSQEKLTEQVKRSIIAVPKKDLNTSTSITETRAYNVNNKIYCAESKNYCGLCQNSFSKESHLTEHIAVHYMDNPFTCSICKKKFSTEDKLTEHINATHTHSCVMCYKTYRDRTSLEKHLIVHTSERPLAVKAIRKMGKNVKKKGFRGVKSTDCSYTEYLCEICNRPFMHQLNLRNHLKSHSHPKLLECELCPLRFTTKDYLRNHMTVHTGERPYKCKLCKKAFTISQNLKRHYLYHSGIKPYVCSVCGKRFAEKASLKKHHLVHTGEKPYKCHICKKGMSQLGSLRRHMYLHTGDGPFACDICQKRFPYRIVLKYHMIIHTGARPYKCDLCGKDFNQKGNLKAHKLSHMGIYRSTMKNFTKAVRIETMRKLGV